MRSDRKPPSPLIPYFSNVGEVVHIAGRLKLFLNSVAALRGSGALHKVGCTMGHWHHGPLGTMGHCDGPPKNSGLTGL